MDSGLSLDWARPSATRVFPCKHWEGSISTEVQQPIDGVGQEDAHEHWRSSGHLLRNDVLRRLPGGHWEAFEAGPQSNTGVIIFSIFYTQLLTKKTIYISGTAVWRVVKNVSDHTWLISAQTSGDNLRGFGVLPEGKGSFQPVLLSADRKALLCWPKVPDISSVRHLGQSQGTTRAQATRVQKPQLIRREVSTRVARFHVTLLPWHQEIDFD